MHHVLPNSLRAFQPINMSDVMTGLTAPVKNVFSETDMSLSQLDIIPSLADIHCVSEPLPLCEKTIVHVQSSSNLIFSKMASAGLHVALFTMVGLLGLSALPAHEQESIAIEMIVEEPQQTASLALAEPPPVDEPVVDSQEPQLVEVADISEPVIPPLDAEVIQHKPEPQKTVVKPQPVKIKKMAQKKEVIKQTRISQAPVAEYASAQIASGPSASERASAAASFSGTLRSWLERHKRYPQEARNQSQQGIVLLSFVMDRSGRVLSHRIQRGSGHDLLDSEVRSLIARAQPLPSIPDMMGKSQMAVTVPIQFKIR